MGYRVVCDFWCVHIKYKKCHFGMHARNQYRWGSAVLHDVLFARVCVTNISVVCVRVCMHAMNTGDEGSAVGLLLLRIMSMKPFRCTRTLTAWPYSRTQTKITNKKISYPMMKAVVAAAAWVFFSTLFVHVCMKKMWSFFFSWEIVKSTCSAYAFLSFVFYFNFIVYCLFNMCRL